jgi:hypothetical protein
VWQVGLKARGVALGMVCFTCVFITLWVAIGESIHKNYETPTPVRLLDPILFHSFLTADTTRGQYWCWISPKYPGERLGGEYVWMWIALFGSVILYVPLYFWAEGFWSVDASYKFHWSNPDKRTGYTQRRATLGILL